ncbi:MAG: ABC transporter ATP-binding protein/permease [Spirochaetaceae bacterium]|jgi:ATP-binding cassette subfamily B protein|nr:ABC transporter ATP-binding protein/permease [Spirochaetaceae bacterium]
MGNIKWIWEYMGRPRKVYIGGLALAGITAGMIIINPMLARRLIDDVVLPANPEPLLGILGIMMGATLLRLSLRYGMVILMELKSTETMTAIRQRMYDIVQGQDYRFLDKIRTGNLMTRMTSDLDMLRHFVSWICYQFVDAVVLFIATITFLLFVNWKLSLCLASITPLILFLSERFMRRIRPRFVLLREKLTKLSTTVTENIDGNRVVKAFAREEYEKDQFEKHNAGYRDTSYENALISAKYQPLLEALSQLLLVITLAVGGVFLIRNDMTPGEYLSFSSLTWALSQPFRMMSLLLADFQRFNAAAAMITEILNAKPFITDKPGAFKLIRPAGRVEFKNVGLTLGGTPVLKDINFKIEPGQTLGILGSTGAGKTVLVNMLLRFQEPDAGEVLLDGQNVQKYTLSSLRRRIGIAMQEVFLFSDTVYANISYGRPDLDRNSIKQQAVIADADRFITGLSDGYETIVGERGVGLSGGQRQRIALARALAVKPAVLILDDTTSAVDSETEGYIQDQLRRLDYPCTKIIIAQRITSFRGADLILVMDQGRIVERGTHDELMANPGFYQRIWKLQNNVEDEAIQGGKKWVKKY